MIVQIYEIQTPQEAQAMIDLGVDHIGTVLVSEASWQDSALKQTVETIQSAGRKSSMIPLFTDTDLIARVIEYYHPDIIHFCESLATNGASRLTVYETLQRQISIRDRYSDIEIMRSIPITRAGKLDQENTLETAALFEPYSDWLLTDTVLMDDGKVSDGAQPVNGFVGITGETCDWDVARALVRASKIPVILAGGVGPANAKEGIAIVNPAGIDSCTLTNATDEQGRPVRFKKDLKKVAALVACARKVADS